MLSRSHSRPTNLRIRATCDWLECWHEGTEFIVYEASNGLAFILCHDQFQTHFIDNGGEVDLTPDDLRAGKSTQFTCIEA